MSETIGWGKFHRIRRDVIAAGLPHYAFIDRESRGGRYTTTYRENEVFLYLEDAELFCLSPEENLMRVPLSTVKKVYLGTSVSDSEVTCSINSRVGRQVVFGDHSYRNGDDKIAEVLRVQFRTFIEEIQRNLIEQGWDRKVTFEARGPCSRVVGCLTVFTLIGLAPTLLTVLWMYWLENVSPSEIEASSWLMTGLTLVICAVCISLALNLNRVLGPRIPFERAKTPDAVFDSADFAITNQCRRSHSAERFNNYTIPEFEKGVYQYTDAKGYLKRYQVTEKEIVARIWKENGGDWEERYCLGEIVRVNLNQRVLNLYVISITFRDGNTWRITTEDCNPSVGNQRAHAETQRARFRYWLDHLHEQFMNRELSSRIDFTSGNSATHKLERVGMWAFNGIWLGIVSFLVLAMLSGMWSLNLLISAFVLGLLGVMSNVISSLLSTKEQTLPYSPESLPWRHAPGETTRHLDMTEKRKYYEQASDKA